MRKVRDYILLRPNNIQFIKYLFVGGFNFIFGFITFYLFLHILHLNYILALTLTWVPGVLLTYYLNFLWVFKPEDKIRFKGHFLKYFSSQLLSFVLNLVALHYIVENTSFDPFYVQCALIPLIVIFNFTTAKFWALKSKNI